VQGGPATGQLYAQNCAGCHDARAVKLHAPDRNIISRTSADAIYRSLKTGSIAENAKRLNDAQKRQIAEFLSRNQLPGERHSDISAMKNRCPAAPLGDPFQGPTSNGWSADLSKSRFQPAAAGGMTAAQVPSLKFKWAFAFPNASSAWSQPTVLVGRVYVGSSNGFVYGLSADTGCVYWSFQAKGGVRSAISMGPALMTNSGGSSTSRYPLYFGDLTANVYAVDAATGDVLWMREADAVPGARITAAPKLFDGRLYVPVSSWEATARGTESECCKLRGSVVAYDAMRSLRMPAESVPPRSTA
jgi:polyvinyl alcohol dehydrogenase (cytochrome)